MRYYINYDQQTTHSEKQQENAAMEARHVADMLKRGYTVVDRSVWKTYRYAHPAPVDWIVRVNGDARRALETLAAEQNVRPQDMAAAIIRDWLRAHKRLPQ